MTKTPDQRREQTETDMLSVLPMQAVHGRCPACGGVTLFLADGGHITCPNSDCPRPDLVNELIGEIADARTHAAYTFCSQLVGHVNMTAFAKKITEKVTAVAHRKEAVAYANEQKQRADHAEQRLARIAALAAAHPVTIDTALIHEALEQPARTTVNNPAGPCPACRRADQAGLAPDEQHPTCRTPTSKETP